MKFTINRELLDGTLKRVARFAAKADSPMPIVSSIRLVATGTTLALTATDMDAVITETLPLLESEPGETCVPADRLKSLVASLRTKETVWIELIDSRLRIKSGHTRAALDSLSPGDFPEFDKSMPPPQVRVKAGELDRVLAMTMPAMASDAVRAALFGLSIVYERNGISAVASDGRHGALCRLYAEDATEFPTIILPRPVCEKLRDLLKGVSGTIDIATTPSHMSIATGDWSVISKLIDGKFPGHNQWMARPVDTPVTASSKELSDILRRFDAVVDMDNNKLKQRGALVEIADGIMKFTDSAGAIQDQMDVAYTGDPVQFGFSTLQMEGAIAALGSAEVELHIRARELALRLCAAGEEEESFTITPYRI